MKVVIAGYGIEGRASYDYYTGQGHTVAVADERSEINVPDGAETILGSGAFGKLGGFDLIVRSPGINSNKLPYPGKVWSATNEFFAKCETPIIGVTGSKGKGTTSSLIHSILQAAGIKVLLVGNIGKPALEVLEEAKDCDVIVYELSSFQLWDAVRSPHIAVVLGVEKDHLDVHADMDDYVSAKANIRRHQNERDYCYYHPTNPYSERIARSFSEHYASEDAIKKELREENAYRYASEESVYVKDGNFVDNMERFVIPVSSLRLPGNHNIENACAAIAAAQHFTLDSQAIEAGLAAFTGLEHRLKLVGEVNRVKFYDDSIATTPGSAIAALKAFDQPKVIILGGSDKGAEYDLLVKTCKEADASVIAIGQTGERIAALGRSAGVNVRELGSASMDEVVAAAVEQAVPGGVVILSPSSASFDMYRNYAERGNAFIEAVARLGSEK